MLITSLLAIVAVEQTPAAMRSPLQAQAEALADSPTPVRYAFIKKVVPGYGVSEQRFRYLSTDDQVRIAKNAYYLAAMDKVMLVHRNIAPLTDIINTFKDGNDAERVCLQFEQKYKAIFGTWPPIVPVNVDEFVERMLSNSTIR